MTAQTQRIQRRYVNGIGAGGGLLAIALIAFVSVVGLVSLSFWPGAGGDHAARDSVTLGPARSAGPSGQRSEPASPPAATATATVRPGVESTGAGPGAATRKAGHGHKAADKGSGDGAAAPSPPASSHAPANPVPVSPPSSTPSGKRANTSGGSDEIHGKSGDEHASHSSNPGNSPRSRVSHRNGNSHGIGHSHGNGDSNGQANGHSNGHSNGE